MWKRDFSSFDLDNFKNEITHNINWAIVYNQSTNVNYNTTYFITEFEKIFNKHALFKKLGKTKAKLYMFPWITDDIRNALKFSDKLHSKFSSCKANEMKTLLWTRYKRQINIVTELLRNSKIDYYRNYFTENTKNHKKN